MTAAYPAALVAVVAAALALLALGWAPGLAAGLPLFLLGVVLWTLERRRPRRPLDRTPIATDALHMLVSSSGTSFVLGLSVQAAGLVAVVAGGSLWPSEAPLLVQLALGLLLGELGAWWGHRLCHRNRWLWRLHALHHSSEQLYLLSSGRTHPLNAAWTWALQTAPLVLLGASPELLALHGVTTGSIGMFQHCNLAVAEARWTRWLFATPSLHRTHHDREDGCCNYGNNLIVWDLLFGTRRVELEPVAFGVGDLDTPRGFLAQLALPFRWARHSR